MGLLFCERCGKSIEAFSLCDECEKEWDPEKEIRERDDFDKRHRGKE